jgi:hypothetical protein
MTTALVIGVAVFQDDCAVHALVSLAVFGVAVECQSFLKVFPPMRFFAKVVSQQQIPAVVRHRN